MTKPIAFLFPAFPVLHQTFVLWEVLGLRRRGVAIQLYSLKRPSTATQQPEGAALEREVHYLPATWSPSVVRANCQLLRRAPARYAGVFPRLASEWWRDRRAGQSWQHKRASEQAPERLFTLREYLEGRFNRSPLLYLLKSFWLVPQAVYLGSRLRAEGIERVHAHWASYPATVALIMHWLFDLPFSFTAHAYDIYLVPRLLTVKVREAELVVTCAHVNAAYLQSLAPAGPPGRIVVNYHGTDLGRFHPQEQSAVGGRQSAGFGQPTPGPLLGKEGEPVILTCGRLEPYKGHHVLLRACAVMATRARCVLVGEGPQRERLEELAAELGIGDRVTFTGPLPQGELVRLYAGADVFVLASVILERSGKRDVIPNVLVEAMAMELPVVASDVSGIGELVRDGLTGRLVPANDPAALARALDDLLANDAERRRLARAGREKVVADFDREKNIEALAGWFSEPPF